MFSFGNKFHTKTSLTLEVKKSCSCTFPDISVLGFSWLGVVRNGTCRSSRGPKGTLPLGGGSIFSPARWLDPRGGVLKKTLRGHPPPHALSSPRLRHRRPRPPASAPSPSLSAHRGRALCGTGGCAPVGDPLLQSPEGGPSLLLKGGQRAGSLPVAVFQVNKSRVGPSADPWGQMEAMGSGPLVPEKG